MELEEKNKIIDHCKKVIMALGGSMSGLDQAMNGTVASTEESGVHQKVESKSVLEALLKGEVTKEVEELRYRTYLVNREADFHKEADRKNIKYSDVQKNHFINGAIRFRQPNIMTKMGLAESLGTPLEHLKESGSIKVHYENMSKFNISDYASEINVDVNMNSNKIELSFIIPSAKDASPVKYRQFDNAIRQCVGNDRASEFLFGGINNVQFTTYQSIGENNDVEYNFINPMLPKVTCLPSCDGYVIKFHCRDMQRVDLLDKYYSASMADKYANNEKKDLTLGSVRDEFKCNMCGTKMTREEMESSASRNNGHILCHTCEQIYNLAVIEESKDKRFVKLEYGEGGVRK